MTVASQEFPEVVDGFLFLVMSVCYLSLRVLPLSCVLSDACIHALLVFYYCMLSMLLVRVFTTPIRLGFSLGFLIQSKKVRTSLKKKARLPPAMFCGPNPLFVRSAASPGKRSDQVQILDGESDSQMILKRFQDGPKPPIK